MRTATDKPLPPLPDALARVATLLTIDQAAFALDVSRRTIHRLIRSGRLRPVRVLGHALFDPDALAEMAIAPDEPDGTSRGHRVP